MTYLGYCPDLAKRFNIECDCCCSCHEDENNGYDSFCEVEFEDGYYDACCNMRNIIMKLDEKK